MNSFVHVVDNTIRVQEETERVKDAMSRITSYSVVDIPHELREVRGGGGAYLSHLHMARSNSWPLVIFQTIDQFN